MHTPRCQSNTAEAGVDSQAHLRIDRNLHRALKADLCIAPAALPNRPRSACRCCKTVGAGACTMHMAQAVPCLGPDKLQAGLTAQQPCWRLNLAALWDCIGKGPTCCVQHMLSVQRDHIKGVVPQHKAVLVQQLCIAMLACSGSKAAVPICLQ